MSNQIEPDTPVQFMPGVGPERAGRLARLGIESARDLLFHLPHRYIRRRKIDQLARVFSQDDEDVDQVMLDGTIRNVRKRRVKGGKVMVEAKVGDQTGSIRAVWFNMEYLADELERGTEIRLSGEPEFHRGSISMTHPDFEYPLETEDGDEQASMIPVYPSTEGISQKQIRTFVDRALDELSGNLSPLLPASLRSERDLLPFPDAVERIHRPGNRNPEDARRTLQYLRALFYFLALQSRSDEALDDTSPYEIAVNERIDRRIRNRFPFSLTDAQNRVIEEMRRDFREGHVMYRLMQGDVGSGKTVVALYAMLAAVASGYQAALMAPTSVLAEQHFQTIERYLNPSDVSIELLTGSLSESERESVYDALEHGDADLVVGTHALLEDPVQFQELALVVMDEQQRFGVRHRTQLVSKGKDPHILVTTATPIPRSLALTLYGDLDLSVIDEMPPGRKPVRTVVRSRSKLNAACHFIRDKLEDGRQAFFVYPLVEESDELSLTSAENMHEKLDEEIYPDVRVGLLHGQMSESDKHETMTAFREGEIRVLVSTVIIEVGVDVPNATIMVIDHAERYGLSQLHQLRGRIGRGEHASYCILLSDRQGETARERLSIFEDTDDGFQIAEEDLRLRGPGSLLGTRQHGMPELDLLNMASDARLLSTARSDARTLLEQDPDLEHHTALREQVESSYPDPDQLLRSG